ncbi:hypothetical protein FD723_40205 (plasmid) [Nostoc sp. C052]|uniref:hypothetical protein n=1 Tax=Nostoc sp. C052 TaxID=2576902 RepID=UPI0015C3BDD9|nr:hypothetical protein [Nostoc sp. C052]QLE46437.1 hypothetical protein FD723_40205 [Nostoc sp. C052]
MKAIEQEVVDSPVWEWIANDQDVYSDLKCRYQDISTEIVGVADKPAAMMLRQAVIIGILENYLAAPIIFDPELLSSDRLKGIAESFIMQIKED